MSAAALGTLGGVLVLGGWGVWFYRLNQVRVPRNRIPWYGAMTLGALFGLVGLAGESGWIGGFLGGLAVVGGSAFIAFGLTGGQAKVRPAVAVGEPVVDFTAVDAEEKSFDLASLRGKPFLLKFFRGHW